MRGRRAHGYAAAVVAALAATVALSWPAAPAGARTPRPGPNVPVTPENLVDRTASNSPMVAADPTNSRFVALANRLDGPDFGCALQVSGDGGRGWVSADPVPHLPPGADKCYAPEIAFDRRGRLYYLFLGLHGAGNSPTGAFLTTSSDRARTFTAPRQVLGPERYQVRMAIDPTEGGAGRLHLVWLEATTPPPLGGLAPPPNPLMASYSDDGGRTFSRPVQVSDPDRQLVIAPAVAIGPHHDVHVLYDDLGADRVDYQGLEGPTFDGRWSLVATASTDGGRHFERGVTVDDAIVPPERVMLVFTMPPASLAADGAGRLFAVWDDARNGDWDVFLRSSSDGGRSWTDPRRLNDDPPDDGRHQYLPHVSVAPGGRVDVAFYDRRGNAENRGNDVYFTSSDDHGRTFSPNVKVTTLDSDSMIGPRYDVPSAAGLNEFGSRIALLSGRATALVAWTDTRNTGRAFPAQDIFAAPVAVHSSTAARSSTPRLPFLVTALVVLAAAVAVGLARRHRRIAQR